MPQRLTIGVFARLTGLTPRALRLYAREGLLRPEVISSETGYRYYALEQARLAERIRLLRSVGLPLDEIRLVLDHAQAATEHRALLQHRRRIEAQMRASQAALETLTTLHVRDIDAYPVALKAVPEQPVLSLRRCTAISQIEAVRAHAFDELSGALHRLGLAATGPGFSASVSDGQYAPDEEIDLTARWAFDVCVPVAAVLEHHHVPSRVLPAGTVAYAVHTGPYQPLFQVYRKIAGWLVGQGLQHGGRTREIYTFGPPQSHEPEQFRTEVQFYLA